MKIIKKNLALFFLFFIMGTLTGSLIWEVFERLLHILNIPIKLTIENPIKLFDFYVLSMSFRANPGSIIGALSGILLFKQV